MGKIIGVLSSGKEPEDIFLDFESRAGLLHHFTFSLQMRSHPKTRR